MKYIFLILSMICISFASIAQDAIDIKTNNNIQSDAYLNSLVKRKFKDPTGNDRQNWSGMGSAFLNLLGSNGSTDLTLSPTWFTITHFRKVANNDTNFVESEYRRQWFARNLQLNFGATPNSKNQIHLDAGSVGFKFAIINNKTATESDYKKLNDILDLSDKVNMILQKYKYIDNEKYHSVIDSYENDPSKQLITTLPKALIDELKASFKNRKLESLLTLTDSMKTTLDNNLKKKPILTFSNNYKYDFSKSQKGSVNFSSDFSFYIGSNSYDLSASYVWTPDTTKRTSTLVRNVFTIDFGPDFKLSKSFEVKTALDYVHTNGPLYKNEHPDKFDISVTPRIKINSQFWLPIIIKYDIKNPQFFGFLSIQYSLK